MDLHPFIPVSPLYYKSSKGSVLYPLVSIPGLMGRGVGYVIGGAV